ncbi:MAG: helix-turn-helix domain-containing protein [Panacibacter sp.]
MVKCDQYLSLQYFLLPGCSISWHRLICCPRHWLQEKRLSEARHLIERKKKPSAIYLDLGFESLAHFSASFNKKYGKAPIEWLN